jgi:hypothetical protein
MSEDQKALYGESGLPIAVAPEKAADVPATVFDLPTYHCVLMFAWWLDDFVIAGIFTKKKDAEDLRDRLKKQRPALSCIVSEYPYEWLCHFLASTVTDKFYRPLMKLAGLKDPAEEAEERRRQDGLLQFDLTSFKWVRRDL